jgi:hypothetical protein
MVTSVSEEPAVSIFTSTLREEGACSSQTLITLMSVHSAITQKITKKIFTAQKTPNLVLC